MTEGTDSVVLRRKLRPAAASETTPAGSEAGPVTPSRALRTSFARAASDSIGLILNVLGVADETLDLDDLLERLTDGMGLISLLGPNGPLGFAAIDIETRAAIVECQTTGRLIAAKAQAGRAMTRTDAALVAPVIARFLTELPQACAGTVLGGWADGITVGPHWENARVATLLLEPTQFRMVRMTLDLGVAERQGDVILALPLQAKAPPKDAPAPPSNDWTERLNDAVLAAPALIDAVLHRMRLPLRSIENFNVGQIVPLSGVTVGSVRVEGPGRALVARARLGQVAGMRAIRIQAPEAPTLQETALRPAQGAAPLIEQPVSAKASPPGKDPSIASPKETSQPVEA